MPLARAELRWHVQVTGSINPPVERDSRSLHVVHITAEMAPIAKVCDTLTISMPDLAIPSTHLPPNGVPLQTVRYHANAIGS